MDYTKEKYMWKTVQYSKNQVDKAAHTIIQEDISKEEKEQALAIIDNWRAAHAFPMNTFAINLKKKALKFPGSIVAQRVKRLDTIIGKLKRIPDMQLSRMQDLGGCRVIVKTVEEVYKLKNDIIKSRIRHIKHNEKDYIASPNPNTGYRGVHLIYKYISDRNKKYNGLFIEIQIRSHLQHVWATAVETIGTFTQNGLKFNQGSKEWRRFFQLCAGLFALEEKTAIPQNIPASEEVLLNELMELIADLNVFDKLNTIAVVSKTYRRWEKRAKKVDKSGYFLLVLDTKIGELTITYYQPGEKSINQAIEQYMRFEESKEDYQDAVLVSAQSIKDLQHAYPNYFADIKSFSSCLWNILRRRATNIINK